MNADIEELASAGMRQFTETMRVSPDLAARTLRRHRHRQRRLVLRAGMVVTAAGAVTAAAVIAAVAHGPATKAAPIAVPVLRVRLLAAIDTASGDILYTPSPGQPLQGGQYPAYPQPGQEVHVRIGPDVGSDGKIYKDGEYSFKMPAANPATNYVDNLDQGGLNLSGTFLWVDHLNHTWGVRHSKFILGFTLDAGGIHAEIANGQFTIIGPVELHGRRAIELKFNVPPDSEPQAHVTAERMWVDAATYLPVQGYVLWSDGRHSVFDYVFLRPTPKRLAKLRPVIPPGYTKVSHPRTAGRKPV